MLALGGSLCGSPGRRHKMPSRRHQHRRRYCLGQSPRPCHCRGLASWISAMLRTCRRHNRPITSNRLPDFASIHSPLTNDLSRKRSGLLSYATVIASFYHLACVLGRRTLNGRLGGIVVECSTFLWLIPYGLIFCSVNTRYD